METVLAEMFFIALIYEEFLKKLRKHLNMSVIIHPGLKMLLTPANCPEHRHIQLTTVASLWRKAVNPRIQRAGISKYLAFCFRTTERIKGLFKKELAMGVNTTNIAASRLTHIESHIMRLFLTEPHTLINISLPVMMSTAG